MVHRPDYYYILLHQKLELSTIQFRYMKHCGHLENSGHFEKNGGAISKTFKCGIDYLHARFENFNTKSTVFIPIYNMCTDSIYDAWRSS